MQTRLFHINLKEIDPQQSAVFRWKKQNEDPKAI